MSDDDRKGTAAETSLGLVWTSKSDLLIGNWHADFIRCPAGHCAAMAREGGQRSYALRKKAGQMTATCFDHRQIKSNRTIDTTVMQLDCSRHRLVPSSTVAIRPAG